MQARALILEAHHTTHIEGTQLTLEQSERLLAGEPVPEADPEEVRELLNYRDAFDLVAEYLGSGEAITEGLHIRNQVVGNLALKTYPQPRPQSTTDSDPRSPPYLSEMEETYIYSRPSQEQSEIFDAQDAWDEILGAGRRPVASKLNEMLDHIRGFGYKGGGLDEMFRACLEKTKGRARDPVGWMISALKNGRYP